MILKDLLEGVKVVSMLEGLGEKDVKDLKIDHRKVKKGDVFIALKGVNADGNDYVFQALENGALCVVSEKDLGDLPCVQVKNARRAYALMSKHYFGNACDHMRLIAITGTNGKTTTASTIASLLQTAGAKIGIVGTLGARYNNKNIDTGFTTPDPYLLHKLFADMKKDGQEFVVMETSAHALALDKLEGINFEIGVLTNITEDHLDFFQSMDDYAQAKFKLFENGRVKLGFVCSGKDYVDVLAQTAEVPLLWYGTGMCDDVKALDIKKTFAGSEFVCDYMGERFPIETPLIGGYNIENALAAIAVVRSLGVDEKLISLGMSCLTPVEGRFNVIRMNGVNVIIDFAHTPDGLEKVLSTARELTGGKLSVVFGCGGNRDKKKRPIMGKIASCWADEVVLTSDNPRFEKPLDIIEEIRQGVAGECVIQPNRKKAIEDVLSRAQSGQTVVIAGKGGERYQEINGRKTPYNDFDVVYRFYRKNIKPVNNSSKKHEIDDENDIN